MGPMHIFACNGWALGGLLLAASLLLAGCDSTPSQPPGSARTPSANSDTTSSNRPAGDPEANNNEQHEGYTPEPPTFVCEPDAGSVAPLRALTRLELANTLHDLVAWALGDAAQAATIMLAAAPALAQIPPDDQRLSGAPGELSQAHVDAHYATASAVAAALTHDRATIARLIGRCASDPDNQGGSAPQASPELEPSAPLRFDLDCISGFIRRFGLHALRRPLDGDEVAFFRDEAFGTPVLDLGSPGAGDVAGSDDLAGATGVAELRELLTVMLMSPELLFHLELGGELVPGSHDVVLLTSYELASRLSYQFWRSLPDEALFAAAADGSLMTDDGYRAAVERVFADPRTVATIDQFFAQWLDLDALPQPADEVGTEPFDTFAGNDRPTPALRQHMADEVLAATRHQVWDAGGDLDDLFLDDRSYATTPDLAAIYEVPVWDGASPPPRFPDGERAGLITRAALLVSGTWHTLPMHKGITLRRRMLCDTPGNPPEGAQNATVDLAGPVTQRQYAEALTMQEGTSCVGCHAWMNPLGFATESYDALGRHRQRELTWQEAGDRFKWLPIDTATIPQADRRDPRTAADAFEATDLMLESGKPHACVARFYFRFSFGRLEDLASDGCVLERLRAGLFEGRPLREVLRDVAFAPEFKVRRVGEWDLGGGDDGQP